MVEYTCISTGNVETLENESFGNDDIRIKMSGEEPTLEKFIEAHPGISDEGLTSHVSVMFEAYGLINTDRTHDDLAESQYSVPADRFSFLGQSLGEYMTALERQLCSYDKAGDILAGIRSGLSAAVSFDGYVYDDNQAKKTFLKNFTDFLAGYDVNKGIAGNTFDRHYSFDSRIKGKTEFTPEMKDIFDSMSAAAVKRYIRSIRNVISEMKASKELSDHAFTLRNVRGMIQNGHYRADSPVSYQMLTQVSLIQKALMKEELFRFPVEDFCHVLDIAAMLTDKDLVQQLTDVLPDDSLLRKGIIQASVQAARYLDMTYPDILADISRREADTFDRIHPAYEISFQEDSPDSRKDIFLRTDKGLQVSERNIPFPKFCKSYMDHDYISKNAGFIKEVVADAAGTYPETSVTGLFETGDVSKARTIMKRLDRFDGRETDGEFIIDSSWKDEEVTDSNGRVFLCARLEPVSGLPAEQKKELMERTWGMKAEDYDMLIKSGVTGENAIGFIMKMPLDRNGRPRFTKALSELNHTQASAYPSAGKTPLEMLAGMDGFSFDFLTKYPNLMEILSENPEFIYSISQRFDNPKILRAWDSVACGILNDPDISYEYGTGEYFGEMFSAFSRATAELGAQIMRKELVFDGEDRHACAKAFTELIPTEKTISAIRDFIAETFEMPEREKEKHASGVYDAIYDEFEDIMNGTQEPAYQSPVEKRLSELFDGRYHFVPKILPLLTTVCRSDERHKEQENSSFMGNLHILPPERIVSDFSRHRISQIASFAGPEQILLALECPMEKLPEAERDLIYTYADKNNISKIIDNFDIFEDMKGKSREMIRNVLEASDNMNSESMRAISHMTAREYITVKEMSRFRNDVMHYEQNYGYRFSDNSVDIPGKDTVAEDPGRHLKAYILAPDDYRNITVGYDTDCCQHFNGAGEDCTYVATSNPDSGIWIIEDENTGKVEAQAWVWYDRDSDTFVFDNVEFANDQKVESYSGLLSAYTSALPQANVHMGMGYNAMTGIGKDIDPAVDPVPGAPAYEIRSGTDRCYGEPSEYMADPYSDYDDSARVLKRAGEPLVKMDNDIRITHEDIKACPVPDKELLGGQIVPSDEVSKAYCIMEEMDRHGYQGYLHSEDLDGHGHVVITFSGNSHKETPDEFPPEITEDLDSAYNIYYDVTSGQTLAKDRNGDLIPDETTGRLDKLFHDLDRSTGNETAISEDIIIDREYMIETDEEDYDDIAEDRD